MSEGRSLVRRGRSHVFGDEVTLDDIIPHRFAAQRIIDPGQLVAHLFELLDADFARRVRPGDLVLAGRNFASGKPRVQGLIALAALDLAVVCTSMPYKMLRRAVARSMAVAVGAAEPAALAATGDEIEVDFRTGMLWNITQDRHSRLPPMSPVLADIVSSGGSEAILRDWLARHPEQRG